MSDSDNKNDLTSITDLAQFEHLEDAESDKKLRKNSIDDLPEIPEESPDSTFDEQTQDDIEVPEDINSKAEEETSDEKEEAESNTFDSSFESDDNTFSDTTTDEGESEGNDFTEFAFETPSEPSEETEEEEEEEVEPEAEVEEEKEETEEVGPEPEIEEPKEEIIPKSAPLENVTPINKNVSLENFNDIRTFAQNMTYGQIALSGNPPYSVMLKNIKHNDDQEDILIILKNHAIVNDENEKSIRDGLARGYLLISQLSEFSAIYIALKLRRFDLELFVGLSEEIHPPKNYSNEDAIGKVTEENLEQNKKISLNIEKAPVPLNEIILTTLPTIEDKKIIKYLGIITEYTTVSHTEVDPTEESLQDTYHNLAEKLRYQALKLKGNGIIGINYQLTPLEDNSKNYKITCSGSAVIYS